MGKTIGLKQLAQKNYILVQNLPAEITASIGEIEDAFDAIIYGQSGNGKSSCTAELLIALSLAMGAKVEYINYEEGHGKTVQDNFIKRHNMLEKIGNQLLLTDHLQFEELRKRMARKKSAKVWIVDSLQASGLTYDQCKTLKEQFVLSRKRKIIIYISWCEGIEPKGAHARAVKYYANIEMRVEGFMMFPTSRYGGNKPYVIWEEGARKHWGKDFEKKAGITKHKKEKVQKQEEKITTLVIAQPEEKPVFKQSLEEIKISV